LDQRRYKSIRKEFRNHIHNGNLYHQVELSRYHVLYTDLISPLDHYYQIYRGKNRIVPLQTVDILILAMGIELSHTFGRERMCVLTSDHRMNDLCNLLKTRGKVAALKEDYLLSIAKELNLDMSPELFPHVLHLTKAKISELEEAFGRWPLEVPKRSRTRV
jgi:hypothetical protein